MNRKFVSIVASASVFLAASAAWAADNYMKIEGVEGEASGEIEVHSWSWGASNPTSVGSSGMSAGRVSNVPPPVRGRRIGPDMEPDLRALASVSEVQGFTVRFSKSSPLLARMCAKGNHIPKATIKARGETYELIGATVAECAIVGQTIGDGYRDTAPARISTNMTTPKQTQGVDFGQRCAGAACSPPPEVTMTLTGQMRHTKTGHVTLMK